MPGRIEFTPGILKDLVPAALHIGCEDYQFSIRLEYPPAFSEHSDGVVNMLDDVAEGHGIERFIGKARAGKRTRDHRNGEKLFSQLRGNRVGFDALNFPSCLPHQEKEFSISTTDLEEPSPPGIIQAHDA